jgi:hypothetical protein
MAIREQRRHAVANNTHCRITTWVKDPKDVDTGNLLVSRFPRLRELAVPPSSEKTTLVFLQVSFYSLLRLLDNHKPSVDMYLADSIIQIASAATSGDSCFSLRTYIQQFFDKSDHSVIVGAYG